MTWNRGDRITSGSDYIESLRGRELTVYLQGERVEEPVDHPIIRPSINAMAATYDLAVEDPEMASADSPFTRSPVNRFLHVPESAADEGSTPTTHYKDRVYSSFRHANCSTLAG